MCARTVKKLEPSLSKDESESELDEPLEVRLARRIAVDASEVRRVRVAHVVAFVVHRAVEDVERFDTELEPHLVGDLRRLREVHVELPVARAPQPIVPEHRLPGLE